ncbi:hypothetical protein C8Q78DRAFT_1063546 [Trametes maxima]|nr:hypothetical protein C8Q78DRAFT_1063546 [Trametes maxima]
MQPVHFLRIRTCTIEQPSNTVYAHTRHAQRFLRDEYRPDRPPQEPNTNTAGYVPLWQNTCAPSQPQKRSHVTTQPGLPLIAPLSSAAAPPYSEFLLRRARGMLRPARARARARVTVRTPLFTSFKQPAANRAVPRRVAPHRRLRNLRRRLFDRAHCSLPASAIYDDGWWSLRPVAVPTLVCTANFCHPQSCAFPLILDV